MQIRVEYRDTLGVKGNCIEAVVKNERYTFEKAEIDAVMMITTDSGPFFDDMCLIIKIDAETEILIMSEHPDYQKFLFDELAKLINIDYQAIIQASSCVENEIFVLYKRGTI